MRAGVPAELTKAALRKVWSEDAAIRDFIGIAENQWDFTDPTSIPGFGPLEATDNVAELVAQAMGKLEDRIAEPAEDEDAPTAVTGDAAPLPTETVQNKTAAALSHSEVGDEESSRESAVTKVSEPQQPSEAHQVYHAVAPQHEPKRRKHGRALPD